jgi:hypothetical protein
MTVRVRKFIKDHIADTGPSTEAELAAVCQTAGVASGRFERVMQRMVTRGKLIKDGDTYTVAA